MISVFISYSHVDEELRKQLDVHLSSLRRQGIVDVWHDRKIMAGEEFSKEIDAALIRADLILLLVSADFINSDYCYSVELKEALRRHDAGEAVVVPVILRACEWHDLEFGKLRATPTDGKPVRLFPDLDSAFLEVVRDIKAAILNLKKRERSQPPAVAAASVPAGGTVSDIPRSGNLRVRASFTDFDRDQFRADAFEYIARYFESSLVELQNRNSSIRSNFRRIDATAFEAAVYDGSGKQRSRCGIWLGTTAGLGGFGGDIGYSSNGIGSRNSYNESLSVGDDGTSLGLSAMGMFGSSGGRDEKKLLTQEGAAEHLWTAFIAPLQR